MWRNKSGVKSITDNTVSLCRTFCESATRPHRPAPRHASLLLAPSPPQPGPGLEGREPPAGTSRPNQAPPRHEEEVNLGRGQMPVPEQPLQVQRRHPAPCGGESEGVPERLRAHSALDAGANGNALHGPLDGPRRQTKRFVHAKPTTEERRDARSYWNGSNPAPPVGLVADTGVQAVVLQGYSLPGKTDELTDKHPCVQQRPNNSFFAQSPAGTGEPLRLIGG
jgi:hypothetical protein